MRTLASIPSLSFLLDLVWLADHPGDRVVYRHLSLSPLKDVFWPTGLPTQEELSLEAARSLAENGLVGALRLWGKQLSAGGDSPLGCGDRPWLMGFNANFDKFIQIADDFEKTRGCEKMLGDFCQESGLRTPCLL